MIGLALSLAEFTAKRHEAAWRFAERRGRCTHDLFSYGSERLSPRATRMSAGRLGFAGEKQLFERAPFCVRTQAHFRAFGSR